LLSEEDAALHADTQALSLVADEINGVFPGLLWHCLPDLKRFEHEKDCAPTDHVAVAKRRKRMCNIKECFCLIKYPFVCRREQEMTIQGS
jgi:hypothetical protein